MALMPGKLFSKTCTKMTLHERFTAYREQASAISAQANTFQQRVLQQRQASAENRRLAQQMANRPSVIAALKLKKRSLQQRLGQKKSYQAMANTPVKNRLNLGFRQQQRVQNRLGQRNVRGKRGFKRGRGANQNISNFNRPGTSPLLKARLGIPKANQGKFPRGFNRKRAYFTLRNQNTNVSPKFKRGGGKSRGQSRGGGRGGSRKSWINSRSALPTKTELDNELDQYMAETKSGSSQYLNY